MSDALKHLARLCCLCGIPIRSNPSNMCATCISTQVDVTEDIVKELTIIHCQFCDSYFQPPKQWITASLESRELLTYCLKKIKGLSKVKLVDADFVWTEPHSKRIKVKLTVQKEYNGAIVQGSCVVTFTVQNNMCSECNRRSSNTDVWTACVQVRQHVPHKRTFFYLEQMILKHKAHENTINVKSLHEGVDFFFGTKAAAQKFVDFLQSVVPQKHRHDKSLVSHDTKSNSYNFKYTFSVELSPICKDDLVCLPLKLSHNNGGIGPLVVCSRVTSSLQFVDPLTTSTCQIDATTYFRYNFKALRSSSHLVSYIVLDVEPMENLKGRFRMADVTVARESDFGISDRTYYVRSFLGSVLKPGDMALGYDLDHAILVNDDLEAFIEKGNSIPEVILVKKSYDKARKKRQRRGLQRRWKLNQLNMEIDDPRRTADQEDRDRELFLQEIEEDKDLQSQIPLVLDQTADRPLDDAMQTDSDEDDIDIDESTLIA